MFITRQKSVRRLAVLALFAILAVAAYGFAASNTVPASEAGDGQGAIGGFTVSNIDYELDGTDPTLIDSVDFDLSPAAFDGQAWVQFLNGATPIGSGFCTLSAGGTHAACVNIDAPVLTATALRVVAVD